MIKYYMACVVFLLPLMCVAQNSVEGFVKDQNGKPLDGALVYAPDLNKSALTNSLGFYELTNLPAGKIRIQYSYVGHSSEVETVELINGDFKLDVVLLFTSIETEEVVVTGGYSATQHENAVKIESMSPDLIRGKSSPNFMELITKIPGVDMISKGSGVAKPVIRGLSMNDILVLSNGVRFENYQYSSHHPLGIDEFGIADVEVIKGPASLLYGSDAVGGVINFIKEKPALQNCLEGDYNLQLYSNSLGFTNNLGIKASGDKLFGGVRFGQKSNADYLQGGGTFVPNSRFNEQSFKTNIGFAGQSGIFKLYYDYNAQNLGLVEDEAIEQINTRGRKPMIFYQQLRTHLLSSQNRLFLGAMKVDINAAYQNTVLAHLAEKESYEIQMALGTLTYEAKLYLPSSVNSEYIIGFQGFNQDNNNLNNRETILLPNAVTNNYSGFILLQHTWFDKLRVQAGLRYDDKTLSSVAVGSTDNLATYRPALNKSYQSFSGSIGGTYELTHTLLFRANLASAFRTPNLAELTSNGQHEARYEIGKSDLVSEQSLEGDASLHFHNKAIAFDLAAFYNAIDNYIYIAPTGQFTADALPIYRYQQNDSKLYGGEAGIHIHPQSLDWLHFLTTYAYVKGVQTNGNNLPFIPAQKIDFEIRGEANRLFFVYKPFASLNVQSAFDQNHPAPEESGTPGYSLINFSIGGECSIAKQVLMFSFGVNNFFDKNYIDHLSTLKEVGYYNPGRSITFSLKIPFEVGLK